VLATTLVPINFDSITAERARAMSDRVVVAEFVTGRPIMTWNNVTVIGAADRDDGAERTAVLKGNRLDLDMGERVRVVGVLKVYDRKADTVGGVFVPAWVEVRIRQAR
jgi:hypothetical protein